MNKDLGKSYEKRRNTPRLPIVYTTAEILQKLDYLALVDPETFRDLTAPAPHDQTEAGAPAPSRGLLVTAAWVGTTRLIDNMEVEFRG